MIVGTAGVIDKSLLTSSSAVQTLDGPVAAIWLVAYAFGGLLACAGSVIPRPDWEAAGDKLLLGFCLLNAATIVLNRGLIGGGITAASLLLVAYVLHGRVGDLHESSRRDRRLHDIPMAGPDRRELS
jgi:hypothetical protein